MKINVYSAIKSFLKTRNNFIYLFLLITSLGIKPALLRAQAFPFLSMGISHSQDFQSRISSPDLLPPLIPDPIIQLRIDPASSPSPITLAQNDTTNIRLCISTRIRLSASVPGVDMDTLRFRWKNDNIFFSDLLIGTDSTLEVDIFTGVYRLEIAGNNTNFEDATTILEICTDNQGPQNARIETNTRASSICTTGPAIQLQAKAEADFFGPCSGDQFTYSWSKDGLALGVSTSTLDIGPGASDQGVYEVTISNSCASASATTTINSSSSPPTLPLINSPSGFDQVCNGDSLLLLATGSSPDAFLWFREGDSTLLAQGDSLYVKLAGNYILEAVNGCGSNRDSMEIFLTGTPKSLSVDRSLFLPCSPDDTVILGANGTSFDDQGLFTAIFDSIVWRRDGIPIATINYPPGPTLGKLDVTTSGTYDFVYYSICGQLSSPSQVVSFTQSPDSIRLLADTLGLCLPSIPEITLGFASNAQADTIVWQSSSDNINFISFGDSMNTQRITSPGFYRVRLANRCGSFFSDTLEIQQSSDISLVKSSIFADTTVSCTGSLIIRTENLGPGALYTWVRMEDSQTTQTNDSSLVISQSGTYQVSGFNACDQTIISSPVSFVVGTQASNVRISPSSDQIVCASEGSIADTLLALADNVSANSIYRWFRNGTEISNDTLLRISQSGNYYFSLENECSIQFSDSIEVSFTIPPEAGPIVLTADPCQDPNFAILNVQTVADNPTFSWFRDAEVLAFAVTSVPQINVTQSGTYRVVVSNTCNPSGVSSSAIPVDIGPTLPSPVINSAPIPNVNQICPGEVLQLRADDLNGLTNLRYRWFRGSRLLENDTSQVINILENGSYQVEVFLPGANSCSVLSAPYLVFARTPPVLLVSANGPLAFCEGDSVQLSASSLVLPSRWEWYQDNSLISTDQSIFASITGSYRVDAFYEDTNPAFPCQTIISKTVDVVSERVPEPNFIITSGILQALDTAQFYQWSLNGVPILNANQAQYLPLDSGQYTLTISSGFGCFGISAPQFHPGTFLDVTEAVRIFPNPNNGQFKVVFVSEDVAQAFLSDSRGSIIYDLSELIKVNSISGFGEVEVNGLEPGMYFLQILSEGKLLSKKILVL